MTTKAEMVAILKAENPTLQVGNEEEGYTQLSAAEYTAQIAQWADNRLAKEAAELQAQQIEIQKAAILAKLGLTADELRIATS